MEAQAPVAANRSWAPKEPRSEHCTCAPRGFVPGGGAPAAIISSSSWMTFSSCSFFCLLWMRLFVGMVPGAQKGRVLAALAPCALRSPSDVRGQGRAFFARAARFARANTSHKAQGKARNAPAVCYIPEQAIRGARSK